MKQILRLILSVASLWGYQLQPAVTDSVYFLTYLARYMRNISSVYCQEKPLSESLIGEFGKGSLGTMTPKTLAHAIADRVDPALFLRGASTSEHQCSTKCTPDICSWSKFAQEHNLEQPGDNFYQMNWWEYYRMYIDYAVNDMKLNALRFSIEWALVQPHGPDSWDNEVLNHYADLFSYAIKSGITPVVCFHHYTDPKWFLDWGGFEKEQNIPYFESYCQKVYEHIMNTVMHDTIALDGLTAMRPRQPLWATYNAPEGYAFRGYHQQLGPPADPKRAGLPLVAQVIKNMLEAHVGVYKKLKESHKNNFVSCGAAPAVGFLKNIHQLDPAKNTWSQYIALPVTRCMIGIADMIQNGSIYRFFTHGEYRVHLPFFINIKHINEDAKHSLDFIGLNYYSNRFIYLTDTVKPKDPNLCTDNEIYYHYPQGLYRAINELHTRLIRPYEKNNLNKHLSCIVAENGIATNDHVKRNRFYHEYLLAIYRAMQNDIIIEGYLPWTLATNYEWPAIHNNSKRDYGLCNVNPNDPSKLVVKEGAASFMEFTHHLAAYEADMKHKKNTKLVLSNDPGITHQNEST